MTTWADAHSRAAVMASQLHSHLDINLDRPIDVFGAIQQLGIILGFDKLESTSGLYLPAGGAQKHPGILINSQHPRSRQRYTASHELGHHMFNHSVMVDDDLEGGLRRESWQQWPDREKEAEAFGAWFLMPRRLLRAGLNTHGIKVPQNPLDVYALSLWLGTSYTATVRQLGTTKIIDNQLATRWAALAPKTIKESLSEGVAMPSYRNDVWWLDEHADGHPIDLVPGDRMILSLPEDVSTGHTWQIDVMMPNMEVLIDSFIDDWEPHAQEQWATPTPGPGDDELPGGPAPRYLIMDLSREADDGIYHLHLSLVRPWEAAPVRSFELLLSVNKALHGIQVEQDRLAVTM